ncbi:rhodanese-like domain-containing protein [Enterococcus dispar]|uniref:Rhodanese domain-containing protein n=1 Tax=Enterococcus dispar ATCC 51266 TaxID=1139219 RepID=S1NB27_9ENTE|nr:rhodanese-like domain-containing protein [Enterococcus dispar]EOT38867.1 hypothetical protein OMK_02349 [Enterococcus dispar ATCC 51266]EOW86232.1 hypothetical protein I569_01555 [Enterococcus dispar ATCC 51266]
MEKTISNNDFNELLQKENLVVIDVREADEFAAGHIPNAKNLPLSQLENRFFELAKDTHYYVICHSGRRSEIACQFLTAQGYQVTNVLGGMMDWKGAVVDGR